MPRNKRGNNNSQQFSGQNRKERRANAAKKARNDSNRNGGGKRNKQSVSNDRWECKHQNGRQVRDEDHSYVAEAVEPMNQVQSEFLNDMREKSLAVFMAPAGCGKCLGVDTPILMADMTIKYVQDIVVGDNLMGPDGTPRKVLDTTTGRDMLYKVSQVKGLDYVVNSKHKLSLKVSFSDRKAYKKGQILNIEVDKYLQLGSSLKSKVLKGYKGTFEKLSGCEEDLAYTLGAWLGDGTTSAANITLNNWDVDFIYKGISDELPTEYKWRVIPSSVKDNCKTYSIVGGFKSWLERKSLLGYKRIPKEYLVAEENTRLKLLAGLLDTDGYLSRNCFEIVQKSLDLAQDIQLLCTSLGLYTEVKKVFKSCQNFSGDYYYRLNISGNTDKIPTRVPRKKATPRKQKKDVLCTGVEVSMLEEGTYYGFSVDKDCLFCLGDGTVTHNSHIAASEACDWLKSGEFDKIYLTRPNVGMGKSLGSLKGDLRDKFEPLLLPLIDVIKERYGAGFYESALNNGTIEFVPMEYIRGRSIKDVVIVDEAQNTTPDEMYTLLTRIADGGILIAIGDPTQNDLRGETGIEWLVDFVDRHEDLQEFVGVTEATSDDIVRGGLCKMTVKAREKDIVNGK